MTALVPDPLQESRVFQAFKKGPPNNAAALTAEWNAVQAATLTPEQELAIIRWAHLNAFGTEPPAGEPIDFRKAFPGAVIVL